MDNSEQKAVNTETKATQSARQINTEEPQTSHPEGENNHSPEAGAQEARDQEGNAVDSSTQGATGTDVEKETAQTEGSHELQNEPEEQEVTEQAAKTVEIDEEEMLFTRRKVRNLEDENKKLNNELEALKDRLIRLTAEYENFRKRTAREREDIAADTTACVLGDILPVMDNLERALITETDDLPGLKEGVQMTLDQFVLAMKKIGVELIPTDQGFDPELHEAVMHEVDESRGQREVSEVFLKGYRKDKRVIRHSVVKVVN